MGVAKDKFRYLSIGWTIYMDSYKGFIVRRFFVYMCYIRVILIKFSKKPNICRIIRENPIPLPYQVRKMGLFSVAQGRKHEGKELRSSRHCQVICLDLKGGPALKGECRIV
jgi:hypothetical protein